MAHIFEFAGRTARFRTPRFAAIILALALTACDPSDPTDPVTNAEPLAGPETGVETGVETAVETGLAPSLLTSAYQGGIPFGHFGMPNSAFGVVNSGAKQTVEPSYILNSLRDAKARGGKVILMLAGRDVYYKDGNGHFSFTKWKARIYRYRNLNLSSYVTSGTLVGHFMVDEPQDKNNWNGVPISGATLEAMAKYSKSLWPGLPTIVRAPPAKIRWSGTYRYLDAAWAQVANPRGTLNVSAFVNENISSAKSLGLGLVVGLNISKGNRNFTRMTPSQIRSWGSTLLNSSYPCAFISWTYEGAYLGRSDVKDALRYLRSKAQNRASKSCRT